MAPKTVDHNNKMTKTINHPDHYVSRFLMKPKLRIDAHYDFASAMAEAFINYANKADFIYRTCLTCKNWNEQGELCKLYNQRPPAKVIVLACDSWEDDNEIPF